MWKKIHVELKFLRLSSFTFKTRVLLLPHSVLLHSNPGNSSFTSSSSQHSSSFRPSVQTQRFTIQTQRSSSVLRRQIVPPSSSDRSSCRQIVLRSRFLHLPGFRSSSSSFCSSSTGLHLRSAGSPSSLLLSMFFTKKIES